MVLQCPHHGAVNETRTFFEVSSAMLSNVCASRIVVAGGGGGLMLDLTPTCFVMNAVNASRSRPPSYAIGSEPSPGNHFSATHRVSHLATRDRKENTYWGSR
jgi:hypothetical protein